MKMKILKPRKNENVEEELDQAAIETANEEAVGEADENTENAMDKADATDAVDTDDADDDSDTKRVISDSLISCDGLVKIYKTDEVEVMALQGLELEVKAGELMAIIGKSGSGKSTLLNMLGGLEKPSAGKLYVDGKDLFAMSEQELVEYRKYTVGFVWQKSSRNLFSYMTVLENIEAPMYKKDKKYCRERAMSLLEKVGLAHKAGVFPNQLSGGEQQRVAIAVALANEPQILLADEPTGAVDSKTSNMIQDLFRQLNEEIGITIIIVTHDISLANKVNRVVMISDGKIGTEKIMKAEYRDKMNELESDSFSADDSHDEFSVLDKAGRVQLNAEMLEAAGIDSNKVKIRVENGQLIITRENE